MPSPSSPECCPLLSILERLNAEYKHRLNCATCLVNPQFCEAFCRGDVSAIQHAVRLEDMLVKRGELIVRKR